MNDVSSAPSTAVALAIMPSAEAIFGRFEYREPVDQIVKKPEFLTRVLY
jgi:hypothetical protein